MANRWWAVALWGVVAAGVYVGVTAARPHAGSWNDGGRLAAAESLVDRGTLAIDDSIFVKVPPEEPGKARPYHAGNTILLAGGTMDKMFIAGHFYSHHPPLPLVGAAGVYKVWRLLGGPSAADRPDVYIRMMTIATAGVPYAIALVLVAVLVGPVLQLPGPAAVVLTAGFAFATVAPGYARHVSSHVVLMAVAAGVCVLVAVAEDRGSLGRRAAAGIGALAGVGYTLDGVVGPALVLAAAGYVGWRGPWVNLVVAGIAALPWAVAHHAVNYAVAGVFGPAAAVPEYFNYPGSVFTPESLTGSGLKHTPLGQVNYLFGLFLGPRGFLTNNLPLLLVPAAAVLVWRAGRADRPALLFAGGFALLSVGPYALYSNNLSGFCLSIRWFVPLLVPGVWAVGLFLRTRPAAVRPLVWLTVCGLVLGRQMYRVGVWTYDVVPLQFEMSTLALAGWGLMETLARPAAALRAVPAGPPAVTTRSTSAA
jgi:hypothetical protein